jgi:cysteinyl-tRNA synthetase
MAALKVMGNVLGLLQYSTEVFFDRQKKSPATTGGLTYAQINQWIKARNQARKEKNWQEADRMRQELKEDGILLEDLPGGTEWNVK